MFILLTVGGIIIANLINYQLDLLVFGDQSTILRAIGEGGISGILTGLFQWLVLRQYLPNVQWIFIFVLFSMLTSSLSIVQTRLVQTIPGVQVDHPLSLTLLVTIFFAVNIAVVIALGYLQWRILSPYVSRARWWIVLPLIAGVYITSTSFVLESINHRYYGWGGRNLGLLVFNTEIIKFTGLASVQALGFCLLQRKPRENPWLNSPLALAPDIASYWMTQKLAGTLQARITKIWKTDLAESTKLVYLVGVDQTGAITAYEPMNPAATEKVEQTPLPSLVADLATTSSEAESTTPLAKFKVIFTAPGSLNVLPYRSIPLVWLAIATYAGILGMSKVLGFARIMTVL